MTKDKLTSQQLIRLELIALSRNDFSNLPFSACLNRIHLIEKYVSDGIKIEEIEKI